MLTKKSNIPKRVVSLLIGDVLVLCLTPWFILSFPLFNYFGYDFRITDYPYGKVFTFFAIMLFLFCFHLFGLYEFKQTFRENKSYLKIFGAVFTSSVMFVVIFYLFRMEFNSRWAYFYFSCFVFIGILLVRLLYSVVGATNQYSKKIIIFGHNKIGQKIAKKLNENEKGWMTLGAFISENPVDEKDASRTDDIPVVNLEDTLSKTAKSLKPDVLILAIGRNQLQNHISEIIKCRQSGIMIWDVASAYETIDGRIPLDYVDDQWLLFAALNGPDQNTWRFKRIIDIVVSSIGILITFPLILLSLLAVFIESGRPVMIAQKRIGKNGSIFNMYKIRTMTNTVPEPGETGTNKITKNVTYVGRVLRRLHFDEFPQFVNILKGELSLIGPRSELFDFVYQYINQDNLCLNLENIDSEVVENTFCDYIPYIEQRFTVPQGITGWAQVHEPHVSSSYDDMIKKLEYDLYYIKNLTLLLDFKIFIRTIKIMLFGKGK